MLRRRDNFETALPVLRCSFQSPDFCLQSLHQCAQKNSSTGCPCASSGLRFAVRHAARNFQRRSRLSFQRQQIQVLLNPRPDGVSCQRITSLAEKRHRLIAPPLCAAASASTSIEAPSAVADSNPNPACAGK